MENDWNFIVKLDEDMLKGGIIINESVAELIRNVDICYVNEAYFATIVTAFAVIESLLKIESKADDKFYQLIQQNNLDEVVKDELHELRKTRNAIMHNIAEVDEDTILNEHEKFKVEAKELSKKAIINMRKILYRDQLV